VSAVRERLATFKPPLRTGEVSDKDGKLRVVTPSYRAALKWAALLDGMGVLTRVTKIVDYKRRKGLLGAEKVVTYRVYGEL
jgi:hypothetical protein